MEQIKLSSAVGKKAASSGLPAAQIAFANFSLYTSTGKTEGTHAVQLCLVIFYSLVL